MVEQTYPHCRVTEIVERVRSSYQRTKFTQGAYVLARLDIEYHVETVSMDAFQPAVVCTVLPLEDGRLRISNTDFYYVTGRFGE